MNYFCCTDTRRSAVKLHPAINGIDFLEVSDKESDPYRERQTTLYVHFLKPLPPGSISGSNLKIEGGDRIKNIKVVEVTVGADAISPFSPPGEENVLTVKVSQAGDFSTYTLRLVQDSRHNDPPAGFDPLLSNVEFSFKVACPSDFDCKCIPVHIAGPATSPEINYLAKDYATFRQLMLDRMALLLPGWKERNPADIGITLVELLAYVADYLSYRQDAIATEAYLGTARRRIALRRHARLVDYYMHDGCNARAWLHIQVSPGVDGLMLKKEEGANKTRVLTKVNSLPTAFRLDSPQYEKAVNEGATVFELMHNITLYTAHNEMELYTWGGKQCCLPKGATKATLKGRFPNLRTGDILIFSEVLGPETGVPQDADPKHQHAVRLTEVTPSYDLLFGELLSSPPFTSPPVNSPPFNSPPTNSPPAASPPLFSPPLSSPPGNALLLVTEIVWDKIDALLFPLCISGAHGIEKVSVALGNNVLIDHGLTIEDKNKSSLYPDKVPPSHLVYAGKQECGCDQCVQSATQVVPLRFNPTLLNSPLTHAAPFNPNDITVPAAALMSWQVTAALPAITLLETGVEGELKGNQIWKPKRDLLSSAANTREFVAEQEWDGTTYLRFGDNKNGARPTAETQLMAVYRTGNGISGNVGATSLAHIATNDAVIIANMQEHAAVWNPLPAQGGMQPETGEEVKQYAPTAFRTQERAVTTADYEVVARRCDANVQRAAATFRWTGSWKTVFLSVDRLEGLDITEAFEKELRDCLERYRMAGINLEVDSPLYVSLEIEMIVCVLPQFFTGDVKRALLDLFSSGLTSNGQKGIFHPDHFSFGQTVYLSPLYAAAQAVQGVSSVQVTTFQRQGNKEEEALKSGKLILGRREIARLDNDPNFPERGIFNIIMKGGRQ